MKMLKAKIKENKEYVGITLKGKNTSALECIILLDRSIELLKEDFDLDDKGIKDLLEDYRNNLKEKEVL